MAISGDFVIFFFILITSSLRVFFSFRFVFAYFVAQVNSITMKWCKSVNTWSLHNQNTEMLPCDTNQGKIERKDSLNCLVGVRGAARVKRTMFILAPKCLVFDQLRGKPHVMRVKRSIHFKLIYGKFSFLWHTEEKTCFSCGGLHEYRWSTFFVLDLFISLLSSEAQWNRNRNKCKVIDENWSKINKKGENKFKWFDLNRIDSINCFGI